MIDGIAMGPLYIRFYGIMLMLGAVAGGWLAAREVKRRGHRPGDGLGSAGLAHYRRRDRGTPVAYLHAVAERTGARPVTGNGQSLFVAAPCLLDILSIWKGGLGIPGAVIGGVIALYFYARKNKLDFLQWLDIGAPSVALGQAIGRFGNLFNQELYGAPTNLPWKMYIDPQHRLAGFENVDYYHPLFAYELLLNLANMFLLLWVTRDYERNGKKAMCSWST